MAPDPAAAVVVRPAERADAPAIAQLHVDTWRAAYRGLVPDDHPASLSVPARTQTWLDVLDDRTDPAASVLVAERGPALLGFAAVGPCRDEDLAGNSAGELYALYVHAPAWRSGTGRALHDAAVRSLTDAHLSPLTLWVLAGNERAITFYGGRGWRPDGSEKTDQRTGAVLREHRYRLQRRG